MSGVLDLRMTWGGLAVRKQGVGQRRAGNFCPGQWSVSKDLNDLKMRGTLKVYAKSNHKIVWQDLLK